MRAVVRDGYGGPEVLALADMDVPTPLNDEVLVRVEAAGVNMADVDYMRGRPWVARLASGWPRPRRRGLGLDVAGRVEAVGPDVTRIGVGDEVFGDMTDHGFGAFAEYVCAPEAGFAPKPSSLSFEEAATVPQAAVMAIQGLRGRRSIEPGQSVLINGAGGNIGPFAVQLAKAFGAEVTGVDSAKKLEMVTSMGADHVLDYEQADFTQTGQRHDWILDIAAYRSVFESRRALAPRGTYIMVPADMRGVFGSFVIGSFLTLASSQKIGMLPWKAFDLDDVAELTRLIDDGTLKPIIDRRYPLAEVPDALRYQEEGQPVGKIVITI